MTDEQNEGRLSFEAAVALVRQHPDQAAFAAMPVFDEDSDAAAGARVFIIEADGAGGYHVRFVAGPFFANVFAANETLAPGDIPERVREMRFMPTRLEEDWLVGQVQILIQKLVQAAGQATTQMPDYANAAVVGACTDEVFLVSFIERHDKR